MKSLKSIGIVLLALLACVPTLARTVILANTAPIYQETRNGDIHERGTFYEGTRLELWDESDHIRGYGRMVLVKRVKDVRDISSRYRRDLAKEINRTSDYENFFIRESDLEPRRAHPVRVNPGSRRDVIIERRDRYDDGLVREVCYETPRRRVITMNEERRDRGNRNLVGGIFATIGGQVLGEITGNDRLGDVISAVGLGFAAVGAVQVASSQEVFYSDYQIDCRQYYTPDTRVYSFRRQGQRCSTTRYYSNNWGNSYEYFETVCHGRQTSRFVTFERSYEIYGY